MSSTGHICSLTPQAQRTFQTAFSDLSQTVQKLSANDVHIFQTTTLQDVRDAAKGIERQLAARQCLRNMRRVQPFLDGLERYSKTIEVLCNGTPYLPWIWAPVKLALTLASDFTTAFETLISAYAQIGANLPRFDRLGHAFRNEPEFQQVLAAYYADILEFHRRAYKCFRRTGWKFFFHSAWGRFDARFKCVLERLARNSDVIDREANAIAIGQMMAWKETANQTALRKDRERQDAQLSSVLSWLEERIADHDKQFAQDDILDHNLAHRCTGSYEWILKNQKIKQWLRGQNRSPFLWVKGNPGSGKSVLASSLIQFLRQDKQSTVLFYFCSYLSSSGNQAARILKSLSAQLVRQKRSLASYIHDEYIAKGHTPTLQTLKELLPNIIAATQNPRVIVDGIDECMESQHREVIKEITALTALCSVDGLGPTCRAIIFSREVRSIRSMLLKKPTLSLTDERNSITYSITCFVQSRMREIQERFEELDMEGTLLNETAEQIVAKSQGMFLWVRLVLSFLEEDVFTMQDLCNAVKVLPSGLEDFYGRILDRIKTLNPQTLQKASRILEFVAFSKRPLRQFEVLNGLSFCAQTANFDTKSIMSSDVLHICKPFIELNSEGEVSFVHFSVHEYLCNRSGQSFLEKREGEQGLALACVASLRLSTNLINPRCSEDAGILNVGKGYHSLYLYANGYWVDHLLAFFREGGRIHAGDAMSTHLACLERYLSENERTQSYPGPSVSSTDHEGDGLDVSRAYSTLAMLSIFPTVSRTATEILQTRHDQRQENEPNQVTAPIQDIFQSYQAKVSILLNCNDYPGLSREQLATFKKYHTPSAWVCHFFGCVHNTSGFSTQAVRDQHEQSHVPKLICSHPECTYDLDFPSTRALKRHMRDFHDQTRDISDIPLSLRRGLPRTSHTPLKRAQLSANTQETMTMAQKMLESNPAIIRQTDNTPFSPGILNPTIKQNVPPEVKTWAQLKNWASQNPNLVPNWDTNRVLILQVLVYQDRIRARGGQPMPSQMNNNASQQHAEGHDDSVDFMFSKTAPGPIQSAQVRSSPPQHKTNRVRQINSSRSWLLRSDDLRVWSCLDDELRIAAQSALDELWPSMKSNTCSDKEFYSALEDLEDISQVLLHLKAGRLQDYRVKLYLLERQNKKHLLMARQEQDELEGRAREQNITSPRPLAQPFSGLELERPETTTETNMTEAQSKGMTGEIIRKSPSTQPWTASDEAKRSASKVGCRTCRRRKKSCDNGTPECNNCLRGGFICEGYPSLTSNNDTTSYTLLGSSTLNASSLHTINEAAVEEYSVDEYINKLGSPYSHPLQIPANYPSMQWTPSYDGSALPANYLGLTAASTCNSSITREESSNNQFAGDFGNMMRVRSDRTNPSVFSPEDSSFLSAQTNSSNSAYNGTAAGGPFSTPFISRDGNTHGLQPRPVNDQSNANDFRGQSAASTRLPPETTPSIPTTPVHGGPNGNSQPAPHVLETPVDDAQAFATGGFFGLSPRAPNPDWPSNYYSPGTATELQTGPPSQAQPRPSTPIIQFFEANNRSWSPEKSVMGTNAQTGADQDVQRANSTRPSQQLQSRTVYDAAREDQIESPGHVQSPPWDPLVRLYQPGDEAWTPERELLRGTPQRRI